MFLLFMDDGYNIYAPQFGAVRHGFKQNNVS